MTWFSRKGDQRGLKNAGLLILVLKNCNLNNYRPISIISVVAQVFERIVYDQLYNFLNSEEIISNQQSDFHLYTQLLPHF